MPTRTTPTFITGTTTENLELRGPSFADPPMTDNQHGHETDRFERPWST